CVGQCSGYVASILVDARWDSTQWHVWTTLLLERAMATINHAGAIQEGLPVVDQLAGRRENLACWTGVSVALLVKREVFPTEGSVLAIRLIDHRDVGCDLLVLDQPVEGRSRTIGRISRKPRRSRSPAWAMKIARHRGMKKAIVALARRLAVIMHRIWTDGTEFRWTREAAAA